MIEEQDQRMMKDKEVFSRALQYIKPHWTRFFLAFFLLLLNVALEIILPILISQATEELKLTEINIVAIFLLAGTYLILSIINICFSYVLSILLQKTGQQIVVQLREDVFTHIESLSLAQFNEIPVGKLVTRVTNDTVAVSDLFSNLIVNFLKNLLLILGTFVIMFFVSWKLTLFMLIFVVLVTIISLVFRFVSKKIFREERKEISQMNTFLSENLSGMKITQVFNQEERKKEEFEVHNKKLRSAAFKITLAFAFYRPGISFLYILAVATCFAIGIPYVEQGYITAGTFLLFYMYLDHFFGPIQNLSDLLNGFQRALSASERLFTLMDIPPTVVDEKDAIEINSFQGLIEFDHVYFAYEKDNWILKDVSFKIQPGETAAFVGKTGAGKTTILSLLVRNYDIQKGSIRIDGIDIRKIRLTSLRKCIGQMLQDVFLFSGNIESNIRLRNEDITTEQIMEACQYVNADRFIQGTPGGLKEEVRENGTNFSAGQRQLLSFARTIVRKPSILILDEATANIDSETELLIQESLHKMKSIGTMLIVAHRLSTIKDADKIIVIEDGKIIEQGNHETLLKNKGYYYRMWSYIEQ